MFTVTEDMDPNKNDAQARSARTPVSRGMPKVRTVDVCPVTRNGHALLALRDPLRLSDQTILIPQRYAPVLALCDGTRESSAVSAALAVRYGLWVSPAEIERLLHSLDQASLLENDRSAEARQRALAEFHKAPFRPLMDLGVSYPASPEDLNSFLLNYLVEAGDVAPSDTCRGIISPHIDYARGGHVYASTWGRAAKAVREAEIAIVLGTDHFGEDGTWTLTRQNYATPFGVLPTHQDAVSSLAAAIGEERAFEGELRHRSEHSIELAAIWLHFTRGRRPCALVPILCGSFGHFFRGEGDPASDEGVRKITEVLRPLVASGNAIVVAAADLAHVGPAFGGAPLDLISRGRLQASDDELLQCICAGDASGFYAAIRRVEDRNNICGASPIYLALRLLDPAQGERVAYDRCPADTGNTSLVSICGILLG